ncbi:MAG: ATP-binding cassette domain-containing protein [Francisellaceae bacterium]|jgi:ABC-type methionine transport system ATPase subunit|nr:ATP-binding cassette domain-containing protein [Francisellaceae bacterium]MBT6207211.1 ATP-binding cassette domain-containing protein [Francisellaceae bacterium]MBT6539836.1 ATP-binding cassette domain-containing protein [Francisellaceae bacterium]
MLNVKDLEIPYYVPGSSQTNYLKNLSFELNPNEVLGIVSRNQVSKPALLACLLQNQKPLSGSISIGKQNLNLLSGKPLRQARSLIGYVSCENDLLSGRSVLENLELPLRFRGLKRSEISHLTTPLVEYFDLHEILRKRPRNLNNYEITKVKIARALVNKPKVLIMDDITSNLDIKGTQNIISKLRHMRRNYDKAIVMFTQDIDAIKSICDEVSVLHNDQIMSEGNTAQFIVNPKHICSQDIIKSFARAELPWAIRKRLKSQSANGLNAIVRTAFIDAIAPETILSHIIDNFGIKINIINSYSELIQNYGCHVSYIELIGNEQQIELSIDHLTQNRLYTEVLGYVT